MSSWIFLLLVLFMKLLTFIYRVLDASLSASASPDCSLRMAFILSQVDILSSRNVDEAFNIQVILFFICKLSRQTDLYLHTSNFPQVALTCMAKLRDERFLFPGSLSSDNITCLDLILVKQLSNGSCLTILFKLIMSILRNESSEALRRRYVTC